MVRDSSAGLHTPTPDVCSNPQNLWICQFRRQKRLMWLKWGFCDMGEYPGFPGQVSWWELETEKEMCLWRPRRVSVCVRERELMMLHRCLWKWRKESRAKKGSRPLEAGKGKGVYCPLEPPGRRQSWHLVYRTSDLQNYKIINLHCFKPLHFL